jgi:hypothetical protein
MTRRGTIVSGQRVVSFEMRDHADLMVDLVVSEEGRARHFLEPGWRGISFGADGRFIWWWSARRLVVLTPPGEADIEDRQVESDEILIVFRVNDLWLLVCELTVRLWDDAHQLSRYDFSDVVTGARWDADVLVVEILGAPEVRVRVRDRNLTAAGP